jgi:hypothetical protein
LQMGFLQKLLARCQERGIKVVLVNMPLTDINRDLLPPGFYNDVFRPRVREIAKETGQAEFIDLGDAREFNYVDYWDTSHLNNLGGHKLLRYIVPAVKELIKTGQPKASS